MANVRVLVVVAVAVCLAAVRGTSAAVPRDPLTSCAPALDRAAADLAEGRLDAARSGFEGVSKDRSVPPFARSLALLGLARTELARKDLAGANAAWRSLAADASLPQLHRDVANRLMAETERVSNGLPARDPGEYRAKLPSLPEPGAVFHVSASAKVGADGSEGKPFASLEAARDAVRALRKANNGQLPKGGVRVVIGGGAYAANSTFALSAEDSGAADAPIVYQAALGQAPVFTGGVRVTGWRHIADAGMRDRLEPAVREKVLQADLNALGVKDFGDATALRQRPELFCNGVPQTLARWPNDGFVQTGEILGKDTFKVWNSIPGCRDGKFQFTEERPTRWLDEPDVRLYGYWFWDWYEEYQKVAEIDAAAKSFTLAKPWSNYGYRKGQRYYAVNVFRELDCAGEWYLDRRAGIIYWLPPDGVDAAKANTTLSVLSKPFISMENVENVILLGLTFHEARGDGIQIRGGSDCLVAGCTVRQLGGDAIIVNGGRHHGIFGCTMTVLGCGGARVAGGDRKTLTPGNHFVENCTVANISRIKHTYTPAVLLEGCGNRVAHNVFENMPSSAMRIEGNDHLVELNAIRHVVEESDDQGGIDMFGNPLYRGVVIRWNRWSDIRGGTQCGAAGVRLDDMISGTALYGNLFERCGDALFGGVQIHGGKDNLVDGNVFLDCYAGLSFSRWGEKRWLEAVQKFETEAAAQPSASRYPDLARLKVEPDVNLISRSVFAGCKSIFLRDGGVERCALNATLPAGVDVGKLDETGTPQLRRILFEPIPVKEIGTYSHSWKAPL